MSHGSTALGADGEELELESGMELMAFEPDLEDDGSPGFLLARSLVEPAPAELECLGLRAVLLSDTCGVRRARALVDERG